MAVGRDLDAVFMVMEFMEHDLKGLVDEMKQPFSQAEVKTLMMQLFEGTAYMHDNWVLHRCVAAEGLQLRGGVRRGDTDA